MTDAMSTNKTAVVTILGKEYQVACGVNEYDDLLSAARQLDERMRTIRNSGNVIGLERIAVMAALNLCHELMQAQHQAQPHIDESLLERMSSKLDDALNKLSND